MKDKISPYHTWLMLMYGETVESLTQGLKKEANSDDGDDIKEFVEQFNGSYDKAAKELYDTYYELNKT